MFKLWHGDCLELMKDIPDGSIDAVICDPPYGTTQARWDSVIPLDAMWQELKRVIKPNGAIVIFGSQPFTSMLVASNVVMFKYSWVYVKSRATNHLNAKKQPLNNTEDIAVFYKKQCTYNPQITKGNPYTIDCRTKGTELYGKQKPVKFVNNGTRYPLRTINIKSGSNLYGKKIHPTQKPVQLMEYLIRTYTDEGETVLDFTAGSMSTAIACINTNRKCIMIEKDEHYYNTGKGRVIKALQDKGISLDYASFD